MGQVGPEPIDIGSLIDEVSSPERGGTVLFLGSVRRGPDDGEVAAIEYSAYEEMAEQEFGRILASARDRWPAAGFAVRHRIGTLPTGTPSIAVVAASPHRADAFEAARWIIEEAKRRLPIWKREQFDDGTRSWREA